MSKQENMTRKKIKIWTILSLLLVCAFAFFLRSVLVYKAYPLEHEQEIIKYSEEYSIDKHFVCTVIFTESGFNELAVSSRGAIGLMQIMPDTGAWAAQIIGIESFEVQMLYEPTVNIRIGCWYLNYLTEMFDGDAVKVMAAYNAGPSRVAEWVDDDGVLREIAFEETENYIIKIKRNYEIYTGLYHDF